MKNNDKSFRRADAAITLFCIAFLFATLGAIGNRGREHAKRILCASRLQKWGQAIFMHSADNDDDLMFMVRRWGDYPFPHYFAALPPRLYGASWAQDYMREGEFNVYLLNPYIEAITDNFENTGQVTRLMACPGSSESLIVQWSWACWDEFCRPPHPSSYGEYYIEPAYSYWNAGGPRSLSPGDECSANALKDLTVDVLSPDRLLMSDVLAMDYLSGPVFRYNHGARGWAWNLFWHPDIDYPPGHVRADGEQDATGRNQLFGDGRVDWRLISLRFEDNIPSEIIEWGGVGFDENEWNGPGSGWVLRDLCSWY